MCADKDLHQKQLQYMRRLIQDMGWEQFMMDIGSLMAEQVERCDDPDGEQGDYLFKNSCFIHSLREMWQKCGRFKYPDDIAPELK